MLMSDLRYREPKRVKFNPDSDFIADATRRFIAQGGRIKKFTTLPNLEVVEEPNKVNINPDICDPGRVISRNYPLDYFG